MQHPVYPAATQEPFRGGGIVVEGAREGPRVERSLWLLQLQTVYMVLMILLGRILVGIVVRVGTTVEVVVVVATVGAVRVYRKRARTYHALYILYVPINKLR